MMAKKRKKAGKKPAKTQQKDATLDEFKNFLRGNLASCDWDGGSGLVPKFPNFDLMPQDYLAYATEALESPTDANRINCIGHLKRAAECQADTLLHVLSITGHSKAKNFPSKIKAIATMDLMPSRSVAELNRIRNSMEHDYAVPAIDDLSLYFDLVAGFVSAVEGAIFMLVSHAEMDFSAHEDQVPRTNFRINFTPTKPQITCNMNNGHSHMVYNVTPDNWDCFVESLRLLFLLIRNVHTVSAEYVLQRLDTSKATESGSQEPLARLPAP